MVKEVLQAEGKWYKIETWICIEEWRASEAKFRKSVIRETFESGQSKRGLLCIEEWRLLKAAKYYEGCYGGQKAVEPLESAERKENLSNKILYSTKHIF